MAQYGWCLVPDDKANDKKSMWRPVSPADLQTDSGAGDQGQPTMGPDTRSLYRRVADWANRPTTEYQGTLDRPGFTPLEYGERGLTAAAIGAGAPEVGAGSALLKGGKELVTRTPGALAGAHYGGRVAEEVGLPRWTGQAAGGVGGFFLPEAAEKVGGGLASKVARMLGRSGAEGEVGAAAGGVGRVGSAGDLASWTPEDLMQGYIRNQGTPQAEAFARELQRRGVVSSPAGTYRPPQPTGATPMASTLRGKVAQGVDTGGTGGGGGPSPISQSPSTRPAPVEDAIEAARRGAPGQSPAVKSLARKVKKQ